MRISTAYAFQRTQEEIVNRQQKIATTQDQLSTGLRVLKPSDDPYAAAQAERSRSFQAQIEIERRSASFAKSMLDPIDNALGDATNVLSDVRTKITSAGNALLSMSDRKSLATDLLQMRSELLGVANRGDGAGGFLFGGQGTRTAPFVDNGTVSFSAQPGSQSTGRELKVDLSVNGAAIFTDVPGASGNINIFSVIDTAVAALQDASIPSTSLAGSMQPMLGQVDQGMDGVLGARSRIGETLSALDDHQSYLDASEIASKTYNSAISEMDPAKAISDLNAQRTALDAILKTYSQVSGMTLFSYLR